MILAGGILGILGLGLRGDGERSDSKVSCVELIKLG